MLDLEAREIVEEEYTECENCGEDTHIDDMCNYYNFNGYEYTYDCGAVYSECMVCRKARVLTGNHNSSKR